MRNIRISEQYAFLFLGSKPKMKFGTDHQAIDHANNPLFIVDVMLVDVFGQEKPQSLSVTIPHSIEDYGLGDGIFFDQISLSLYTLSSGKSGLSWRAMQAGTFEELQLGEG